MKQLAFVLMVAACSSSGSSGSDMLPKRGERSTDPTIVSATAHCGGEVGTPGQLPDPNTVTVKIAGSDPMGGANLGTCAGMIDSATDQGTFDSSGNCYAEIRYACTAGMTKVFDLTVSNRTGGVTTASVSITVPQ